jgi:hypothetical protein
MSDTEKPNGSVDVDTEQLRVTPVEVVLRAEEMRMSTEEKVDVLLLDVRRLTYQTALLATSLASVEKAVHDKGHLVNNTLTALDTSVKALQALVEQVQERQNAQEDLHVQRHKQLLALLQNK